MTKLFNKLEPKTHVQKALSCLRPLKSEVSNSNWPEGHIRQVQELAGRIRQLIGSGVLSFILYLKHYTNYKQKVVKNTKIAFETVVQTAKSQATSQAMSAAGSKLLKTVANQAATIKV